MKTEVERNKNARKTGRYYIIIYCEITVNYFFAEGAFAGAAAAAAFAGAAFPAAAGAAVGVAVASSCFS